MNGVPVPISDWHLALTIAHERGTNRRPVIVSDEGGLRRGSDAVVAVKAGIGRHELPGHVPGILLLLLLLLLFVIEDVVVVEVVVVFHLDGSMLTRLELARN